MKLLHERNEISRTSALVIDISDGRDCKACSANSFVWIFNIPELVRFLKEHFPEEFQQGLNEAD